MLGKPHGATIFFCLPDCWLAIGMHREGSATGQLDMIFLDFLCLQC
jgi:hypothetical protein